MMDVDVAVSVRSPLTALTLEFCTYARASKRVTVFPSIEPIRLRARAAPIATAVEPVAMARPMTIAKTSKVLVLVSTTSPPL